MKTLLIGSMKKIEHFFKWMNAANEVFEVMLIVSEDMLEAAKIDGANAWTTLWKITIPNVMPSITICTFLTLTNSFKLYDQNLALTAGRPFIQQGGEVIKTTEMLALNIVNSFYASARSRGVGQAKAVIFFVLVAVLSILQLRSTREKEVQQ